MGKWIEKILNIDLSMLYDKQYRIELVKKILPYAIAAYVGNLLSFTYRNSGKSDVLDKILYCVANLADILKDPLPSFHVKDIVCGVLFAVMLKVAVNIKSMDAKHYRKGEEYGSAKWGTKKDIAPFINHKNPDKNLIFSATEMMSLEGRMPSPLYNRNKNVMVVGGSGSGKTRYFAKPNMMQLNCSYVITDPNG